MVFVMHDSLIFSMVLGEFNFAKNLSNFDSFDIFQGQGDKFSFNLFNILFKSGKSLL